MPWNDNSGGGGGPWGSGGGNNNPNNPWGQRPNNNGGGGGRGPEGPDLDDVVRDLQRMFGGLFGGKGGDNDNAGGPGLFGLLLVALAALIVWLFIGQAVYFIQPGEKGVVMRFGAYDRTTDSGMNFKFPAPIETVIRNQFTEVRNVEIGRTDEESLMLTRDENIVDIDFTVQWRVDSRDPENGVRNFEFNVLDPAVAVKAVAESAMREIVGTTDLQPIITTGRTEVAASAKEIIQRTLDEYQAGVEILDVQLTYADPPAGDVVVAFRDVDSARQDRERFVLDARAYANQVVPEARGNAARMLEEAQGYRDSQIARAEGDAARFTQIYDEYVQAPEVTRRRMYLETMENVLRDSELIILDEQGGAVPYLPLDRLGNARNTQGGN